MANYAEQMKKFHILLIVVLGFFLIPTGAFACENDSGNHSCKKEISSKTEKKDCCDKNDNLKKECASKCGHSKCGCPSSSISFTVISEVNFINNTFDFSSEKQKFSNSETFISSGFYSIWLIPKIS